MKLLSRPAFLILLCTSQIAAAQSSTPTANIGRQSTHETNRSFFPKNEQKATKRPSAPQRIAASEPVWMSSETTGRNLNTPLATTDSHVSELELVCRLKRERLQAIHERLKLLLDNPPPSDYGTLKPEVLQDSDGASQHEDAVPALQNIFPTQEFTSENYPEVPQIPSMTESPEQPPEQPPEQSPEQPPEAPAMETASPPVSSELPIDGSPEIASADAMETPVESTPESPTKPDDTAGDEAPNRSFSEMIESLTGDLGAAALPAPKPEEPAPENLTATTVLSSPVDRMKLADSLFAAGEHSLSLQMYDAIDQSKLKRSDRTWLKYQQASCNRRLGMIAEAESIYRQLAGDSDAEWLAETSRWWLDRLADRRDLEVELGEVQAALDTFEKGKKDAINTARQ